MNEVKKPKHYELIDGIESITIIASAMSVESWRGFCLGNILKYRVRAGKKDSLEQDIAKANEYELLFEKHKHLCRDYRPELKLDSDGEKKIKMYFSNMRSSEVQGSGFHLVLDAAHTHQDQAEKCDLEPVPYADIKKFGYKTLDNGKKKLTCRKCGGDGLDESIHNGVFYVKCDNCGESEEGKWTT